MVTNLADNLRAYGEPPYRVAVVHGGPGDAGGTAEVALALSPGRGVLEPLQTALSVAGQAEELAAALDAHGEPPVTLVGHSWGAWLVLLVAAARPDLVGKLILVSSGLLEERFVPVMHAARLARLTPGERREFDAAIATLEGTDSAKDDAFARLALLSTKTDAFDPLPGSHGLAASQADRDAQARIYASVWPEAAQMRGDGRLRAAIESVTCPVVAIHGDSDPSPAEGVRAPLAAWLPRSRFHILERCGHTPWRERHARQAFFALLEEELAAG